MPTVSPVQVSHPLDHRNMRIYKWAALAAGDTAVPLVCGNFSDKTVYFLGTFGGNMGLEGTPDPAGAAAYVTLKDASSTAIATISAAAVRTVLDNAYLIRPTMGAGVAAVDCWVVLASTR